ncbi:hypothetical protein NDU88_002218 [Pleurodeles waltl]|uniref:Uncharacterized protein n=1 Tax=Pleurodeles waltl TaxID=8319 RepID=A0AAV7VDY8_PLEWA|nr:hypothetical protein NDU88_002218 [Pleurodeles waltl]
MGRGPTKSSRRWRHTSGPTGGSGVPGRSGRPERQAAGVAASREQRGAASPISESVRFRCEDGRDGPATIGGGLRPVLWRLESLRCTGGEVLRGYEGPRDWGLGSPSRMTLGPPLSMW